MIWLTSIAYWMARRIFSSASFGLLTLIASQERRVPSPSVSDVFSRVAVVFFGNGVWVVLAYSIAL